MLKMINMHHAGMTSRLELNSEFSILINFMVCSKNTAFSLYLCNLSLLIFFVANKNLGIHYFHTNGNPPHYFCAL